jgi:hypothetical protein
MNINIRRIIDQLIYVSTSSVIFTNVYLVLSDYVLNSKLYLKQKKKNLLANGVTIINVEEMKLLLDSFTEFKIDLISNNNNLFSNFNQDTNYISFEYEENIFTNKYSPVIYQFISYHKNNIIPIKNKSYYNPENRIFIMCIEKISNIHRIHHLMEQYKIDNINICLPPKSNDNYDGIIRNCLDYKIKYYEFENILNLIKTNFYKNKIAVDLHKDAISLEYNKYVEELNDSIIIFGFELGGIPKEFSELCNLKVQINSRKSINVVAALSIILSVIY